MMMMMMMYMKGIKWSKRWGE